jgi:hypothetical protein
MVAVAVLPAPSLEFTVTELTFVPGVTPITLTETTHEAFTGMVEPAREMLPLPAVAVVLPPQLDVRAFGVDTTRPAGSVSVNDTPVFGIVVLGLVIVKVSEVLPLTGIDAAPKTLAILGGELVLTEIFAVAVLPTPWFEFTVTELTFAPGVTPTTLTEMLQEVFGASVEPVSDMLAPPATAKTVPETQFVRRPFGVATEMPAGSESMNPTPVFELAALGLVTVSVSEVVPPTGIDTAPKALEMLGGKAVFTVSVAVAAAPGGASLDVTVDVVLTLVPAVVAVNKVIVIEQLPFAGIVALVTVRLVPEKLLVAKQLSTEPVPVRPAGNTSVNATLVSGAALGLLNVKVIAVVWPTRIVEGENDLTIVGARNGFTVSVAVAAAPGGASLDVTVDVVLTLVPAVVAVNKVIVIEQLPFAGIVALVTVTLVPEKLLEAAQLSTEPEPVRPAGNVSVNETPVSGAALGLLNVKVIAVVWPTRIVEGENDLTIVGARNGFTVSVAVAAAPGGASADVTVEVVLTLMPAVVAVNKGIVIEQLPFAGIVALETVRLVPEKLLEAAQLSVEPEPVRPAGNVSLNATLVSGTLLGLVNVMVIAVVWPTKIVEGEKDLTIVGGTCAKPGLANAVVSTAAASHVRIEKMRKMTNSRSKNILSFAAEISPRPLQPRPRFVTVPRQLYGLARRGIRWLSVKAVVFVRRCKIDTDSYCWTGIRLRYPHPVQFGTGRDGRRSINWSRA